MNSFPLGRHTPIALYQRSTNQGGSKQRPSATRSVFDMQRCTPLWIFESSMKGKTMPINICEEHDCVQSASGSAVSLEPTRTDASSVLVAQEKRSRIVQLR